MILLGGESRQATFTFIPGPTTTAMRANLCLTDEGGEPVGSPVELVWETTTHNQIKIELPHPNNALFKGNDTFSIKLLNLLYVLAMHMYKPEKPLPGASRDSAFNSTRQARTRTTTSVWAKASHSGPTSPSTVQWTNSSCLDLVRSRLNIRLEEHAHLLSILGPKHQIRQYSHSAARIKR